MRSFALLDRWDPVFPTFWGPGSETSLEQALVFDAGSSGTRPEPTGVEGRGNLEANQEIPPEKPVGHVKISKIKSALGHF